MKHQTINSMKHFFKFIILFFVAAQFNISAQSTSELKNDKLEIIDPTVPNSYAEYGLNSFRVQNDFNYVSGGFGELQAGSDLQFSILSSSGLSVLQNLSDPSLSSNYGLSSLNFNYNSFANDAFDDWSIYTTDEGNNRRSLTISEVFGSSVIPTQGVGLHLSPGDSNTGDVYVGVGTFTPSEKLEVDGAVKVNETTDNPQPNVVYGNSTPVAYGVHNFGVTDGYGITSVTKTATGRYTIVFDNPISGNRYFSATPFDTNTVGFISYFSPNSNTITVRTTNAAGVDTDRAFSFFIYGTPQ